MKNGGKNKSVAFIIVFSVYNWLKTIKPVIYATQYNFNLTIGCGYLSQRALLGRVDDVCLAVDSGDVGAHLHTLKAVRLCQAQGKNN